MIRSIPGLFLRKIAEGPVTFVTPVSTVDARMTTRLWSRETRRMGAG
jgi:hypothetical protein